MQNEEGKTYSQWAAFNNSHHTLRLVCVALSVLSSLLIILCFSVGDSRPIVVKEKSGDLDYLIGSKKSVPLAEKNIERLIKKYLSLRYSWDEVNLDKITRNISPFVTKGLQRKTRTQLQQFKTKDFKDKKLSQKITVPEVIVTKESTTAYFYRVLEINQIPLLIPMQVTFGLVKGENNFWNRIGIYINSLSVHEGN